MAGEPSPRFLGAILATDVVGCSRLLEQDETGVLAAIKARRREVLAEMTGEALRCHARTKRTGLQCKERSSEYTNNGVAALSTIDATLMWVFGVL